MSIIPHQFDLRQVIQLYGCPDTAAACALRILRDVRTDECRIADGERFKLQPCMASCEVNDSYERPTKLDLGILPTILERLIDIHQTIKLMNHHLIFPGSASGRSLVGLTCYLRHSFGSADISVDLY